MVRQMLGHKNFTVRSLKIATTNQARMQVPRYPKSNYTTKKLSYENIILTLKFIINISHMLLQQKNLSRPLKFQQREGERERQRERGRGRERERGRERALHIHTHTHTHNPTNQKLNRKKTTFLFKSGQLFLSFSANIYILLFTLSHITIKF